MKLWAVELAGGQVGLFVAPNKSTAKRAAEPAARPQLITRVREATSDDVAWVRQMGGFVPPHPETSDDDRPATAASDRVD